MDELTPICRTKRIQPARGWCATVKRECANCIHLILPLRRLRPPVFLGSQSCNPTSWLAERQLLAGDIESNPGPKPTLKTLLHTLTQSPTLTKSHTITKYTNSPVQPSQSSPHSLSPTTHRLTHPHLSNPICPLCKTHAHTQKACTRCRYIGHGIDDTGLCEAFSSDQNIITIRSPKNVLCNYYV